MTTGMSEQILEMASLDFDMRIKLAGEYDLIAAGAKYHLSCFRKFMRSTMRATKWISRV